MTSLWLWIFFKDPKPAILWSWNILRSWTGDSVKIQRTAQHWLLWSKEGGHIQAFDNSRKIEQKVTLSSLCQAMWSQRGGERITCAVHFPCAYQFKQALGCQWVKKIWCWKYCTSYTTCAGDQLSGPLGQNNSGSRVQNWIVPPNNCYLKAEIFLGSL